MSFIFNALRYPDTGLRLFRFDLRGEGGEIGARLAFPLHTFVANDFFPLGHADDFGQKKRPGGGGAVSHRPAGHDTAANIRKEGRADG